MTVAALDQACRITVSFLVELHTETETEQTIEDKCCMKLLSSRIGTHADMDKFRKAFLVAGTMRVGAMLSVDYGSSLRVSITHRGPDEYLLEIHQRLKSAEERAMMER